MEANYSGPGVTVDGNVVTENTPKSSKLFRQKIKKTIEYLCFITD
jgi:hypothetical protein